MRTTLDIDEDVLRAAKELARREKKSAGAVISALTRQALTTPPASQPRYPNPLPVGAVMDRLADATAIRFHQFWADDVSLLDPRTADRTRIHGPRQLTDLYLLALAVHHGGRLASFDSSIPLTAVRGAETKHLVTI